MLVLLEDFERAVKSRNISRSQVKNKSLFFIILILYFIIAALLSEHNVSIHSLLLQLFNHWFNCILLLLFFITTFSSTFRANIAKLKIVE